MDPYQFDTDSDSDTNFDGFSSQEIRHAERLVSHEDQLSDVSSVSSLESTDDDNSDDDDVEPPDMRENPPQWTDQNLKNFQSPLFNLQDGPRLPHLWDINSEPLDYFKLFITDDIVKKWSNLQINMLNLP